MRVAICLLILFGGGACSPDTGSNRPVDQAALDAELAAALFDGKVFFCPMDLDVRSASEGFCSRCGMALISSLPDPADYAMDLTIVPRVPEPGETATLEFRVRDPWENRTVQSFQVVHEKIFHAFVMSQDLEFFAHEHPVRHPNGEFSLDIELPKPGMYQILADFFPDGGTPQLIAKSFVVPGAIPKPIRLVSDYESPKQGENLQVALVTEPAVPVVGQETEMYFTVTPGKDLSRTSVRGATCWRSAMT